jgi:PKD repeat protein
VTGGHVYTEPGVYTLKLTVTDKDGDSGESIYQYVIVYDPEGGFVTGGGWIDSPPGAYAPDPSLTGKANFGFVAKYKKGAHAPTGQTEFQFQVADLNFHSDTYDWLVVAGPKAQFKGTGTINGAGNYGFMLTALDADLTPSAEVDRFRIKIWDKEDDGAIVYDNQMGAADGAAPATELGGGSIVIHKGK